MPQQDVSAIKYSILSSCQNIHTWTSFDLCKTRSRLTRFERQRKNLQRVIKIV